MAYPQFNCNLTELNQIKWMLQNCIYVLIRVVKLNLAVEAL